MRIYIASRFRTIQATHDFADTLRAAGHEVVSTWHAAEAVNRPLPKPATDRMSDTAIAIATRDLREIDGCDAVIVLTTDCEATPGGLWFEAGYAKGQGKAVYVHGPRWNVFGHLLPDWESA